MRTFSLVTLTFPSPIYIPAPLPSTAPPGTVVQPVKPLPPLKLRIQPPVAHPIVPRNKQTRDQSHR